MSIPCHYREIAHEVAESTFSVGRNPHDVKLIAVSKTVGTDAVACAIEQGATNFAENRPELLIEKAQAFPDMTWHFIGNIQSRRIPDIVAHASLIHSLYHLHHAEKIDKAAKTLEKIQDVLIEVNVSGEDSKGGCSPENLHDLARSVNNLDNVRLVGLMTMAPIADDQTVRETFAGLRRLRDEFRATLKEEDARVFTELSMGMSGDWQIAVYEGATMVRIGRAIFSDLCVG